MSDFDVSMRLHRPEGNLPPEDRKPFEWTKVTTALQICGALLAIPAGAAGVYAAYRSNFSTEVACQTLRAQIITTLEKNVDLDTRRALARRDVAEFERSCAAIDPDAKQVFASMMAPKATAPGKAPDPAASAAAAAAIPDAAKPVVKTSAPANDPISEAIEREAARAAALPAKAPGMVPAPGNTVPATVATPLTSPAVKHNPPAQAAKPVDKPAVVERAAIAPKGEKPVLGEPPAPLGSRLPAEANANPNPAVGKPVQAGVTPNQTPGNAALPVTPRTAALPETAPAAPDNTSVAPMGGPIPPAAPPPLETAQVPSLNAPSAPAAYTPPHQQTMARPEPAKKSGVIPFVSDLFGGAPPRPPGEIARDVPPENGPAN